MSLAPDRTKTRLACTNPLPSQIREGDCSDWGPGECIGRGDIRSCEDKRYGSMKAASPLLMVAATLFASPNAVAENHRASPACLYRNDPSIANGLSLCIRAGTYNHDLCTAIEQVANYSSLPPDYFARLLWRESRFRAYAISPKGALGIAQFMPGTATLRGLTDSTDILEALRRWKHDLETSDWPLQPITPVSRGSLASRCLDLCRWRPEIMSTASPVIPWKNGRSQSSR